MVAVANRLSGGQLWLIIGLGDVLLKFGKEKAPGLPGAFKGVT